MTRDDTRRKALYALGVLLLVAGGAYFVQEVLFTLSITVRALLLLGTVVVFLAGAAASVTYEEELAFGLLVAVFVFLAYVLTRFDVRIGTALVVVGGTFALLLVTVVLLHQRRLSTSTAVARNVVLAVVLVAAVLVGLDVRFSGVAYDVDLREEVRADAGDGNVTRLAVGTATATTTFVFREPVAFPDARACLYTDDGRSTYGVLYRVGSSIFPDSVAGNGEITAEMVVPVPPDAVSTVDGPLPVERAETCPDASDRSRIVLVV